jgi:citrate lyase subunit beta/citryl-CoA lyase
LKNKPFSLAYPVFSAMIRSLAIFDGMMAKIGIAGNTGEKVRSDCLVRITPTSSGGIAIHLESKVDALYGRSIRELTRSALTHFGLGHASVEIHDSGALDFVLAARLEAAIKQVIKTDRSFLPEGRIKQPVRGPRDRFRFTRLYLPGNTPSMMLNAGLHDPCGIILDLEDAVAPSKKQEARFLVRNALAAVDFYGAERMVRINQLPEGLTDLDHIMPASPDLLIVPKVESPVVIHSVNEHIDKLIGEGHGVFLMPIIESALGVEHAFEIASSAGNIVAMAIGLEDYTADLGVSRTASGKESLYARTRLVNACKAAGIQPIDSVYSDVGNEDGLRETASISRSLGFEGMGCIHPRQIPVVHEVFKPGEAEIDRAKTIVRAYEMAEKEGQGVVSLGTKMIDPPVVKRALHIIDLALAMKLIPENWRNE